LQPTTISGTFSQRFSFLQTTQMLPSGQGNRYRISTRIGTPSTKRAIKGTYVSIEPFHTFRYLDEEAFRFNTRQFSDAERFAMVLRRSCGKKLTYEKLTGKEQAAS